MIILLMELKITTTEACLIKGLCCTSFVPNPITFVYDKISSAFHLFFVIKVFKKQFDYLSLLLCKRWVASGQFGNKENVY